MNSNSNKSISFAARLIGLAAASVVGLGIGAAAAKDVYLAAMPTTLCFDAISGSPTTCAVSNPPLPSDPIAVPMWAYAEISQAQFDASDISLAAPSVPGPMIMVGHDVTDTVLNIHLFNALPVVTSLQSPGQRLTSTAPTAALPSSTWINVGTGATTTGVNRPANDTASRVRSMAPETPINGKRTYSFTGLEPGSYLYQAATNPAIQVQMGLYGGIAAHQAVGVAYPGPGPLNPVDFSRQIAVFLGEIDPEVNRNVVPSATGGMIEKLVLGVPTQAPVREYSPSIFLLDQKAYNPDGTLAPAVSGPSETALIRFFNAGLRTHAPTLLNRYMDIVAEDGNLYARPRRQYSVLLEAGKTKDATIFSPLAGEQVVLYDRMLNTGVITGQQPAVPVPTAGDDAYTHTLLASSNTALSVAAPGVLANDASFPPGSAPITARLVSTVAPAAGTLTLNSNGSFTYTPAAGFSGNAIFTYQSIQAGSPSATATVTITVVRLSPVANNDNYAHGILANSTTALTIAAPGVLGNDTPAAIGAPALTASLVTGLSPAGSGTLALNINGSFTYTPTATFSGPVSFTYRANQSGTLSNTATVTITVNRIVPPTAVNDAYTFVAVAGATTPLTIAAPGVLVNDTTTTPPGAALTAQLVTNVAATAGSVTLNSNGGFTYTPTATFGATPANASFTYRAVQGSVPSTNTATVTIAVSRNSPPVARNDEINVPVTTEVIFADVLANDTDANNDIVRIGPASINTIQIMTPPNRGGTAVVQINPATNGVMVFYTTPTAAFRGEDTFTYRVRDATGLFSNIANGKMKVQ